MSLIAPTKGDGVLIRFELAFHALLATAVFLSAGATSADEYPNKPVRLITSTVGGSSDFAARLIANGMSDSLSQQFIVDNRGGGVAAIQIVANAQPDGYTLLYYGSIVWLMPLLQRNLPYSFFRDFTPVSLVLSAPDILLVNPKVPAKSVKELIALARANPGKLNYGSGGIGSSGHLAAELFKSAAGINIVRVGYRGLGPALLALMSGDVQVVFSGAGGDVATHIASGKVKALAISGPKRLEAFPNLPTVAEAGLPGFEYELRSGLIAPAGTPNKIVRLLSKEVAEVVAEPAVKHKFLKTGAEAIGSTPREFSKIIRSEISSIGHLIRQAHIPVK